MEFKLLEELINMKDTKQAQIFTLNRHKLFRVGLVFCFVLVSWLLLLVSVAAAAEPQFLVSWRANSYAPEWYQGKILPNRQTLTQINFDLIDNGKIADISKTKIRWYVNNKLRINEQDGLGMQTLQFYPPWSIVVRDTTEIRIVVVDYKGETIGKIINIPLAAPEVAIQNFGYTEEIGVGSYKFQANPFFFNIGDINDLAFNWTVNGKLAIDDNIDEPSNILNLEINPGIPANANINVEIDVQKLADKSETARKKIELTTR